MRLTRSTTARLVLAPAVRLLGRPACFVSVTVCFFFSSRRRHTRYIGDWSSDVCSSDLPADLLLMEIEEGEVEQPNAMVEEKHEHQSARALTFEPPQLAVDAPTLNAIQRQIAALGSDLDAALAILVQRAQTITRASGAAIALEQGSEMVCRASSGEAPPLGAGWPVGSGVSGVW